MKKTILSAIIVLGSLVSMAQENQSLKESSKTTTKVAFGVKVGLNLATFIGDVKDASAVTSFHSGAVAEIMLNDKFGVQPELLYSGQGTSTE